MAQDVLKLAMSLAPFWYVETPWNEGENVSPESDHANRRKNHSPRGEQYPSKIEDEDLRQIHGIVPSSDAARESARPGTIRPR